MTTSDGICLNGLCSGLSVTTERLMRGVRVHEGWHCINGRGKISGYHVDHVFKGVEKRVQEQHVSRMYRRSLCRAWDRVKRVWVEREKTLFNAENAEELCEHMLDIMRNSEVIEARIKKGIVELLLHHNGVDYVIKLNRTMTKIVTFFPLDELIVKIWKFDACLMVFLITIGKT